MAQAFEIPRGNRTAHPGQLRDRLASAIAKNPATLSRSPLPVRSIGRIGFWNMGPPSGRRKRRAASTACLARPATGPIPGPAIRAKVNRFCSDLTKETTARLAAVEDSRRFWHPIRLCVGFDPFLAEPVYLLFSRPGGNARRNHYCGESHARYSHFQSRSHCGHPVRRRQRRQYRDPLRDRGHTDHHLRRRGDRLHPRQQRPFVDAGRPRLHGPDAGEGPDRGHHHRFPDRAEGAGLFQRPLHQHRRQVGCGQCDLYAEHRQRVDDPGQRLRLREYRFHEARRLPETRLQHQFHLGLGQRAHARRHGARQHGIDGRRRQDAGDADRRQEPDRPVEGPGQERRRRLHLDRSVRQGRQRRSQPTTVSPGSISPTGTRSTESAATPATPPSRAAKVTAGPGPRPATTNGTAASGTALRTTTPRIPTPVSSEFEHPVPGRTMEFVPGAR